LLGLGPRASARQLAVCGGTDVGKERSQNQDTYVIADLRSEDLGKPCSRTDIAVTPRGILLLVCDGMGGAAAGEVAARLAAESIKHVLVKAGPAVCAHPNESLEDAVADANQAIRREAEAHPEERGMGTTCTAAIVLPDRLFISQVGDSRAYLLRDGMLRALTRDQSLASLLVDSGALRPEQVSTSPHRHVLMQALGTRSTISPVTTEIPLQAGDRILLCSDGLHGPVAEDTMAAILTAVGDIDRATHRLIEAALAAGGPDNVTVVVADCA